MKNKYHALSNLFSIFSALFVIVFIISIWSENIVEKDDFSKNKKGDLINHINTSVYCFTSKFIDFYGLQSRCQKDI